MFVLKSTFFTLVPKQAWAPDVYHNQHIVSKVSSMLIEVPGWHKADSRVQSSAQLLLVWASLCGIRSLLWH